MAPWASRIWAQLSRGDAGVGLGSASLPLAAEQALATAFPDVQMALVASHPAVMELPGTVLAHLLCQLPESLHKAAWQAVAEASSDNTRTITIYASRTEDGELISSAARALPQLVAVIAIELDLAAAAVDDAAALQAACHLLSEAKAHDVGEGSVRCHGMTITGCRAACPSLLAQLLELAESSLQRLSLHHCHLDGVVDAIAPAMRKLQQLQSLTVAGKGIRSMDSTAMASLAPAIASLGSLTCFDMSSCRLDVGGAIDLCAAFAQMTGLVELALPAMQVEAPLCQQLSALRALTQLETLRAVAAFDEHGFTHFASQLPALGRLKQLAVSETRPTATKVLASHCKHLMQSQLTCLTVRGGPQTSEALSALAESLQGATSLKRLALADDTRTTFNVAGMAAPRAWCNCLLSLTQLQQLILEDMQDFALFCVTSALPNMPALTQLSLAKCDKVSSEVANHIGGMIALRSLALINCKPDVPALTAVLVNFYHLTKLVLRNCFLKDKSALGLASALSGLSTLQSIDLSGNNMTFLACQVVVKCAARQPELKELRLGRNWCSNVRDWQEKLMLLMPKMADARERLVL